MILESILNLFKDAIFGIFYWIDLPNMADYGTGFQDAFDLISDMLESSKSLINLFLPWDIVRFGIPIVIVVMNFEHIYNFIMWVIKKIPMLGIK